MNINNIKKEFPIFDEKIQNNDLVYLDSANSSQKPKIVLDRINDFYSKQFSNVGRSIHYLAVAATNLYENTRSSVQKYINAKDKNEIVFTKGATEALNLVANTLGQTIIEPNDEILITELEHHSNYVPWHFLRKSKNVKIKFAEINEDGDIPIENIEKEITNKTKVIAITHLSNVTGAVLPIKEITQLAHSKGIIVVVDGCQGGPHLKLDMQDLDCDFYAISCHKMYGPTGIGGLFVQSDWLNTWQPYMTGGGMIKNVSFEQSDFLPAPFRFETGTPNVAGAAGMAAASRWLEHLGWTAIQKREEDLRVFVRDEMNHRSYVQLLCADPDIPLFSFFIEGIHAHDMGTMLDFEGIATRSGHHCTMPLHHKLDIEASTRISLSFLNTIEECRTFLDVLDNTVRYFDEE